MKMNLAQLTNARHGWRKNAKDTSVVEIGEKPHRVLSCKHVTNSDFTVTQRHERFGTEKIYQHLKNQSVAVGDHAHDRTISINKFIIEECDFEGQNDKWHAVKSVKAALKRFPVDPYFGKVKLGQAKWMTKWNL